MPSDLVSEIILQDSYNVRVLSIRGVQLLNEGKLQQALKYAVRTTRPEGTPKLQALYIFGPSDPKPSKLKMRSNIDDHIDASSSIIPGSIMHAQGAQIGAAMDVVMTPSTTNRPSKNVDKWYRGEGKVLSRPISAAWEATLIDCEGIISFDAVLCRGPRHLHASNLSYDSNTNVRFAEGLPMRAANISLQGCHACGTSPEGFLPSKTCQARLPLLAPPPLHASTRRACITPFEHSPDGFLARCADCMRARFCESCYKWWCEDCYTLPEVALNTRSLLADGQGEDDVKVHMGLCVETCLAPSMMAGAGSNGLWG